MESNSTPQSIQGNVKEFHQRLDWQRNFLSQTMDEEKYEYLFHLLELVRNQAESLNPIPSINALLSDWVDRTDVDLNSKENRLHLSNMATLITFLSELNTIYFCINTETDFAKKADQLEKEVRNG